MTDFHKELLDEIIKKWTNEQVNNYIIQLEQRSIELSEWIRHMKAIRKRRTRKLPVDTGPRGGM